MIIMNHNDLIVFPYGSGFGYLPNQVSVGYG